MGIASAWSSIWQGNFRDAANYVFVPEDEITRSKELNNRLAELVADDQAKGLVSADQAQDTLSRIQLNAFPDDPFYYEGRGYFDRADTSPLKGFQEGLESGADNIRNFASKTISEITGLGFRIIPWQVWFVLFIALLIWLAPYFKFIAKRLPTK